MLAAPIGRSRRTTIETDGDHDSGRHGRLKDGTNAAKVNGKRKASLIALENPRERRELTEEVRDMCYQSTELDKLIVKDEESAFEWVEQTFQRRECIKFIPEGNSDR